MTFLPERSSTPTTQAKTIISHSIDVESMEKIRLCLDNILDEQVSAESGNVKHSVGSDRDHLIYWCHGATGAVHLYVLAYKVGCIAYFCSVVTLLGTKQHNP